MSFIISGLYVGLTALLAIILGVRVLRLRRKYGITLGTGDNEELGVASRVHANLLENAPLAMLLLVIAEANGLAPLYLHGLGTLWIVARLLHAIGLNQDKGWTHPGRYWGILVTWVVLISLALVNLWIFIVSMDG